MKKLLFTLILCTVAMSVGYAQFEEGIVVQPTSVVAKRFDESGQLIKEIPSSYTYEGDGKLARYDLPDHYLWSTYTYTNNYLVREYIRHEGGYPIYGESFNYSYENGQVKTKSHIWDQMNESEYWVYYYFPNGRLERIDHKGEYDDDYHEHWIYEYENEGMTRIENYFTSWTSQGMLLRKKTISQYDEAYNLLTKNVENYNTQGELAKTTSTAYAYTTSGKPESEITQTLVSEEWVNSGIVKYEYDDNDRVTEWLVGTWSDEIQGWSFTKRATYEFDVEESTLTVSFYKNDGEGWGWDDYYLYSQPVFFETYLSEQEHALRYYGFDDLYDSEHVNQFVFTLVEMERPPYLDVEEDQTLSCGVYPNPGRDKLNVVAPIDNAVIRIFNMQGQMVKARPFDFSVEISTEALPSGIYVWEIWNGNQKEASGKWVKE